MSFVMKVKSARSYKNRHWVGVQIKEGDFRWGDFAYVQGHSELRIKILSSSIIDSATEAVVLDRTTLTIEEPPFPIEELIGTTLVDRETAFIADQPSLVSHSKERS